MMKERLRVLLLDNIKIISLCCLLLQNSGLAITMRYTMLYKSVEERYIPSTAVLNAEILKLVISMTISYYIDGKGSISSSINMTKEVMSNGKDWMLLIVPSLLYTIQNTLQYFSISLLSAPVFTVLSQLKILTTAVFSVLILSKKLLTMQWISIIILTFGTALVQLSQTNDEDNKKKHILGLISVLCGCMTSGFSGVYLEIVLKSTTSLWIRNAQLALIGIGMSLISCYARDYDAVVTRGFFAGYDEYVLLVILLQAAGGLLVAVVVKYADNVIKGFATSISVILSSLVSMQLFHDVHINVAYILGVSIVLASVYIYGLPATYHVPKVNVVTSTKEAV